jgi:putative inorganic carbon (hco3(-)) transporter
LLPDRYHERKSRPPVTISWPSLRPRVGATRRLLTLQYPIAALLGSVFALFLFQAFLLETRHLAAFVVGVLLLAGAMVLFGRLRDLLLYLLAFNLPFVSIEKSFFVSSETTFVTPGVAVGLAEIAIGSLYAVWLFLIFVAKKEPVPRPSRLDVWVLGFIAAHALSLYGSVSRILTLYEILRLSKYALVYFYLSRNLKRRHVPWILAGIFFTICVQSSLAVVQHNTGRLLGIGRTKGAELDYEQYTVTGFEAVRRAEGTTFDSHALGLFLAMSLPIPFALALNRASPSRNRLAAAAVFVLGLPGLVVSFGRAGWLAFAVACGVVLLFFALWKEWRALAAVSLLVGTLSVPLLVPFARYAHQRLFEAPPELLTARVETVEMAIGLWKESPLIGIGANGYMRALEVHYGIFEGDPYFIPPHNIFVFVLTEIGIVGIFFYVGLMVAAGARAVSLARRADPLLRVLGVGSLAGLVALQVAGVFDPIYVTSVVYFFVWFLVGFVSGLHGLSRAGCG